MPINQFWMNSLVTHFLIKVKKNSDSDTCIHSSVMDTVLQNISCCLPGRD